jgi:hypothetical protein
MDKQFIKRNRELEKELNRLAAMTGIRNQSIGEIFRTADKRWFYKWAGLAASCVAAVIIGTGAVSYMKSRVSGYASMPVGERAAVQSPVQSSNHSSVNSTYLPRRAANERTTAVHKPADIEKKVNDFVYRWKTAWETGVGYSGMYAADFISDRNERLGDYLARKRAYKASRGDTIKLRIHGISKPVVSGDNVCVAFRQEYDSSEYTDSGIKELCIRKRGDELDKIIYENWRQR